MITDSEQLAVFVNRVRQSAWIAVDTEFLRERTYYPELCLVQIASPNEIGLIDILAIDDLSPLTALMDNPDVLKVFHAPDQDLEVFSHRLGITPSPIFDTQIAAALTGLGDQTGYAHMVEALTDVHLAKSHTRTDWTRRPLPEQALVYAADDVRYLAVAYPMLRQQLQTLGRLEWVEADSATLVRTAQQPNDAGTAWKRLRAWHQIEPAQQQILAALAQWRETEAMRSNRPRKWVLSDDALFALARRHPDTIDQLVATKAIPPKTAQRHGKPLLAAIREGAERPAVPLATQPVPMTSEQKTSCKKARQALVICAREFEIPAPLLAKRKELEQMVFGRRDVSALSGWRAEVAGHAVLDVIEGRRHVVGSGDDAKLA